MDAGCAIRLFRCGGPVRCEQPACEFVQRIGFLAVERCEQFVLGGLNGAQRLLQRALPGGGQLQRVSPPVLVAALPAQEALALEIVDEGDHDRGVYSEQAAEVLLGQRGVGRDHGHDVEVAGAEAERGQCALGGGERDFPQLDQQVAGMPSQRLASRRAGRGRRRGHTAKRTSGRLPTR